MKKRQGYVTELTRKARDLKLDIKEDDMEQYADLAFRAFERTAPSPKIQKMSAIPQINFFIKEYMELCAEITNSQMIKYEAQQQIDKILITHKKSTISKCHTMRGLQEHDTASENRNQNDT